MRILITGISGYLGSQLANELTAEHEIAGTVREKSSLSRLFNPECICLIDISKSDWLQQVTLFKPQIVINTAALYGRKNEPLSELIEANVQFPLSILEVLSSADGCTFLNCGTSLPPDVSGYAQTKNQFVALAKKCCEMNENKFIDLKLEHFFGPFDDATKFTTYVINSCRNGNDLNLTAGLQERDFIYIYDLISAIKTILLNLDFLDKIDVVAIGSGTAITVRSFVETIAEITHYNGKLNFGAVPTRQNELMYSCADTRRMASFGWMTKYSLHDAVFDILEKEKQ